MSALKSSTLPPRYEKSLPVVWVPPASCLLSTVGFESEKAPSDSEIRFYYSKLLKFTVGSLFIIMLSFHCACKCGLIRNDSC